MKSVSCYNLCTAGKQFSCNEPLMLIDALLLLHVHNCRWHIVLYQMRNGLNLFSVCIFYSVSSLQSAFCTEWTKIVLLFFSVSRGRSTDFHQGDSDWGWGRLRQNVLVGIGRQSEHFKSSAGFFAKCHQFTSYHHGVNIVNMLMTILSSKRRTLHSISVVNSSFTNSSFTRQNENHVLRLPWKNHIVTQWELQSVLLLYLPTRTLERVQLQQCR